MYKKCFKIEYQKDIQEKDMQEVVELLEKNGYVCIHGITQIKYSDGINETKHHVLVARKYKENNTNKRRIKNGIKK